VYGKIQALLGPGIQLIDTAEAVAARVANLTQERNSTPGEKIIRVFSTGMTHGMQNLLRQCSALEPHHVSHLTLA
jgi:glutamate racemase